MKKVKRANLFFLILIILQIVSPYILRAFIKFINIKNINLALILTINEVVFLIGPIIVYFLITKESPKEVLRFNRVKIGDLGIVILIALLFLPVAGLLGRITSLVFPNNVEKILKIMNPMPLYAMILAIAVTPAICEELTLRGVILSGYKKIDIRKAAVINGLFFSIIHFNLQQSLYTFAMGIIVAFIVYYTNSIFTSMLFHFILNGINVTLSKVFMQQITHAQKLAQVQQSQLVMIVQTIFSCVLAIGCTTLIVLLIMKLKDRNTIQTQDEQENVINDSSRFQIVPKEEKVFTWHVPVGIAIYIIHVSLPYIIPLSK